jgi:hypothetical protein
MQSAQAQWSTATDGGAASRPPLVSR